MKDYELQALQEAFDTIETARQALKTVLCMFAPSHTETKKERTAQEIAEMLLHESMQRHENKAGCIPHLQELEQEFEVMGNELSYEALRRKTLQWQANRDNKEGR